MDIKVTPCREEGLEMCQRCRQCYRECKYDLERGCRPDCVLCNRCILVLKEHFAEFWKEKVWPGREILGHGHQGAG